MFNINSNIAKKDVLNKNITTNSQFKQQQQQQQQHSDIKFSQFFPPRGEVHPVQCRLWGRQSTIYT